MTDTRSTLHRTLGFRPRLWPTLISLPMIVVMLGLGSWQLQRMAWKEGLIDRLESRMMAPAIPAPGAGADIEEFEFRRVTATGEWLHQFEMPLIGRPEKGTVGYHVVTPLRTAEGRVLLVNRGWIPDDRKDAARRPESQPTGTVTVEGIVRRAGLRNSFTPDNEPGRGMWFYVDVPQMAAFAKAEGVPNYYIDELRREAGPQLPIGADPMIGLRNEHLQYAITWFAMAFGLIVVYVMWHRRTEREDRDAAK
ncbi:SURF1 family protein [Oceanibaculum nanhaiense]|jgi:surfeit locus 1 family protein|uniref:SURF1 family protein n=1 Tax=Oceanibaculum nanhaiense TaxID=1909734 RepID=UPI000A397B3B|nr:SURF1 family protein [Oceanibaculum nanhaiense]